MPSIILPSNSRYKDTNAYVDTNGNQFFGPWYRMQIEEKQHYDIYELTIADIGRFDLLAYDYYGDPSLSWVIMDFNGIVDPFFGFTVGQKIKIPYADDVTKMLSG